MLINRKTTLVRYLPSPNETLSFNFTSTPKYLESCDSLLTYLEHKHSKIQTGVPY